MELTVLVDNNTLIDQYYTGEPALCFYIEDEGVPLLFDLGYSGIFLANARKMDIDLGRVQTVAFSHGHNDHTGGLPHLLRACPAARPTVVAHPAAFWPKRYDGVDIGSPLKETAVAEAVPFCPAAAPRQVSENCWFLGEVPRRLPFETGGPIGETQMPDGRWVPDDLPDDSALVYRGKEGLVVVTGCAHHGVCNTVEHAKRTFRGERVAAVIGGFHLMQHGDDERTTATAAYLKESDVGALYPCHCTSFAVKAGIHAVLPVREVGVGLRLTFA